MPRALDPRMTPCTRGGVLKSTRTAQAQLDSSADQMYLFNALPWVVPLGVIGTALGLGLLPLGRRTISLSDRILRGLLIGWAFVIFGAVVAPAPFYTPQDFLRFCALEHFPMPYFGFDFGHRLMNQVLFAVPGFLVGCLSNGRWKWISGGVLVAASPMIEFIQWLVPLLARSCQLEDVSDNWFGLVFGVGAGLAAGAAIRSHSRIQVRNRRR